MLIEAQRSAAFSPSLAERIASELYGITATATPLPGEFDDNFHLIAGDGSEYVLKVMRDSSPYDLVELQCQVLRRLSAFPVRAYVRLARASSSQPQTEGWSGS